MKINRLKGGQNYSNLNQLNFISSSNNNNNNDNNNNHTINENHLNLSIFPLKKNENTHTTLSKNRSIYSKC